MEETVGEVEAAVLQRLVVAAKGLEAEEVERGGGGRREVSPIVEGGHLACRVFPFGVALPELGGAPLRLRPHRFAQLAEV